MQMHKQHIKAQGFTLVELLIAMSISLVVLATVSTVFLSQLKTYKLQEQLTEMNQNARAAMDFMTREIRMAGYGAPDTSTLSNWIDWVSGTTINSLVIIESGTGAAGSDILHIAGCFDSPASTLSAAVSSGDTSLSVQSGSDFNTTTKKVVSINGLENAVITSISGNTLNIDTDPGTAGNQGLQKDHQTDDAVFILKVISYSIVQDTDGTYVLKRNENLGAGRQPLVENITDFQITQSGSAIEITTLEAQTDKPDPDYATNNGYRTMQLRSTVAPPNLDP